MADALVTDELKSLKDELSASQKERLAAPDTPPSSTASGKQDAGKESAEEREMRDQLRELASEVTSYFAEAEKSISTHPTQSVIGALLLGILIGRLLPRR